MEIADERSRPQQGVSRRRVLECMTWAGTGVLWTISGGVRARWALWARRRAAEPAGLTFLQISDSHVGFDKPANPNASARWKRRSADQNHADKTVLHDPYGRYQRIFRRPPNSTMAERIISRRQSDVHYVPGEARLHDEERKF